MQTTLRPPTSEWEIYHRASRTATYGFLAALPLIAVYELLVVFANRDAIAQVRVGAEVWLKQLIAVVGTPGLAAFGGVLVAVGIAVFWYERRKHIPIRARYFGWMILESAVYAVLVAIIVSGLVGAILTSAPWNAIVLLTSDLRPPTAALQAMNDGDLILKLALSVGAGVYEELLFRVLLVGGLFLLMRKLAGGRGLAYALAAVIGAFLFSLVHYLGPLGDVLTAGSFLFRFFFGLMLNVLFLLRGFGIAAWTHALYDIMVVVWFAG